MIHEKVLAEADVHLEMSYQFLMMHGKRFAQSIGIRYFLHSFFFISRIFFKFYIP